MIAKTNDTVTRSHKKDTTVCTSSLCNQTQNLTFEHTREQFWKLYMNKRQHLLGLICTTLLLLQSLWAILKYFVCRYVSVCVACGFLRCKPLLMSLYSLLCCLYIINIKGKILLLNMDKKSNCSSPICCCQSVLLSVHLRLNLEWKTLLSWWISGTNGA